MTALCSGKICTIFPEKGALNFWKACTIALEYSLHNQEKLIKIFDIEYMLNKYMNENGANFSGGEKQKLSIIRALSKESSVVLLDEPTSALDKESINQLIGFLHEKKEKAVVLLISHDPYVLKKCDEIIDIQQFKQENETII